MLLATASGIHPALSALTKDMQCWHGCGEQGHVKQLGKSAFRKDLLAKCFALLLEDSLRTSYGSPSQLPVEYSNSRAQDNGYAGLASDFQPVHPKP